MRHFVWGLALAALSFAGCGGGADELDEEYYGGSGGGELKVDQAVYDSVRTGEMGTEGTRGIAKTIEWQRTGTELGATYLGGAVAVDKILRDDAEDFYGVRVRLQNRRGEPQVLQWRIRFYSLKGEPLMGLNHDGTDTVWRSSCIEPHEYVTVTDSCRLKGAVAFRLFVRAAGSEGEGSADGFGRN